MNNNKELCRDCMFLFCDETVGHYECTESECFTDKEYEVYEDLGYLPDCPYYINDGGYGMLIEPPTEEQDKT